MSTTARTSRQALEKEVRRLRARVDRLESLCAEAYQVATGESVVLPAVEAPEYSEIAAAVYQKKTPL